MYLSCSEAKREAKRRFGEGTSRYQDFMASYEGNTKQRRTDPPLMNTTDMAEGTAKRSVFPKYGEGNERDKD